MSIIGYGTTVEVETAAGSGSFTALALVFSASPPSAEIDTVDTTHFGSADRRREFIPGLTDSGTVSIEMNYVPNSATDQFVEAWRLSFTTRAIRVTFPNGARSSFSGFVLTYQSSVPLDDKMTASLEIKVSGAVTMAAGAAPANTVQPAISGTRQVGQLLTAYAGVWTNAPTFAYQWQQDVAGNGTFSNISGATAATFTLVSGQSTHRVRVVVTATNAIAVVTANSAPSIIVVA